MPIDCRFWYKRLITRLDTSTLKEVFQGSMCEVKKENSSFDFSSNREVQSLTKKEDVSTNSETPAGQAWQKLMNLLMQLRKVCDQYDILYFLI